MTDPEVLGGETHGEVDFKCEKNIKYPSKQLRVPNKCIWIELAVKRLELRRGIGQGKVKHERTGAQFCHLRWMTGVCMSSKCFCS